MSSEEMKINTAELDLTPPEPMPTDEELHQQQFGGRTEAQILAREPITVQLGGEQYEIRPAVIRVQREWSKRFVKVFGEAFTLQATSSDDTAAFQAGFERIMAAMPEQQQELVFLYASEVDRQTREIKCYLPKEKIEDNATAEEMAIALREVVKLAQSPLAQMTQAMSG